uniref:Ribonuclease H-like domain-containing protein n=1 Tax=Tanacetum cinerariifolium TaxID=118510 RepID=A0A699HL22_TANCI|nr:ribonuclease H-like domain-containing protein [Tanacetum cinerariifolium]
MARQCTEHKRKRDATWFKDKVLLVEAQGNGKVLNKKNLEFLADPGIAEGPVTQTVITNNVAYQADDLDAYDSDYDDITTAKVALMANLSRYDSNVLSENTNSSAKQDAMILYVFEKLSNQVTNCNKVSKDNLVANESLSAKLERYKEQIRPMLYDGNVIANETNVISIDDSEETLMLEEQSRSKMLLKQNFRKCFVSQQELSAEQAIWFQMSNPSTESSDSSPVKVDATNELPKLDLDPLAPRLLQNRDAYIDYLKHTHEQADIIRGIVKQAKAKQPLDNALDFACKVFTEVGLKWKPTGRTLTLVGNLCPLTRITSTKVVPRKKTTPHLALTLKPELKVYSRRIKQVKNVGSSKKAKIVESNIANNSEPNHSWGSNATDIPSLSSFVNERLSILFSGESKKQSHKPKSEDTNQKKLYLLHMDLCGPMRVASINGKKYILFIVDDYSRFKRVKFLASNDEAPDFIIKLLKMIQVRLNATVKNIRTDNETEFFNQTPRSYYKSVSISHETSVARTP